MPSPSRRTPITLLAVTTALTTAVALAGTGAAFADTDPTARAAAPAASAAGSVVQTESGAVRGLVSEETRTFRGIPYAAPPTGELRWRSPQRAARWSGVKDATEYGATCAQTAHPVGVASTSEDCLFVDVTTPKRAAKDLPVVVWIHGGSFKNGGTSIYKPERLAAKGGLVVVQAQYRLGALGFLAHPALDSASGKTSGAYGLEDQQAALRWVQRNAAAFGGNPRNITIMGESAGAFSVCDHLASPTAAGLFQRAIIQSGACTQEWSPSSYAAPRPRVVAEGYGRKLGAGLGCRDAACLRRVPAARLLAASAKADFSPVLGGPVLPRTPTQALRTDTVNRVPVLHGVNHDEEHGRFGAQEVVEKTRISEKAYKRLVRKTFGPKAGLVLDRYPVTQSRPAGLVQSTMLTDSLWSGPTARTNQLLSARMPTYAFEFAGDAPWYRGLADPAWPVGSHHLSDVAYLFDLPTVFAPLDPAQARLADEVIARWSAFARTGSPNVPGTLAWPRTHQFDRWVQSLNPAGVTRTDFYADHQLAFWRSLGR